MSSVRLRFWLELVMALGSGALLLLTIAVPDWIEVVFGIDPDAGNGSVERTIAVVLAVITIVFLGLAGFEWRVRQHVNA